MRKCLVTTPQPLHNNAFRREWFGLGDSRTRLALIIGIVLLATGLRCYDLSRIPPGLWYDEAINGLDALKVLDNGPRLFFMTEGHPREPLLVHIIALLFSFLPHNAFTLRLASVLVGIITVPLLYVLVRKATDNVSMALVSMFLLATFRWHIHFSRVSFRTILVPPAMIVMCLFLLQAVHATEPRSQRKNAILAGAMAGGGAYTYLAFRLVPAFLVLFFLYTLITRQCSKRRLFEIISLLIIAAVIIAAPLLVDFAINPSHFKGRVAEVTLFDKGMLHGVGAIVKNACDVTLMFSFRGDHVPKHNIPLKPIFDPIFSVFFYLGSVVAVVRAVKQKNTFCALILLWLCTLLMASVLSFGAPNLLRTLGVVPAVVVLVTMGVFATRQWLSRYCSSTLLQYLLIAILVVFAANNAGQYFYTWARMPETWRDFNSNIADLATTTNSLDSIDYALYIPGDLYHHPTFRFLNHNQHVNPIKNLQQIVCDGKKRTRLVVATVYGQLYRSAVLERIGGVHAMGTISTHGYGTWAQLYRIRPEDFISSETLSEILSRLDIDPADINFNI